MSSSLRWVLSVLLVGCGSSPPPPAKNADPADSERPATREDCIAIIDANVDLQLKAMGINDPVVVEKKKKEIREALKVDVDNCIGRKVTDGKMKCVQSAQNPSAIDECLK